MKNSLALGLLVFVGALVLTNCEIQPKQVASSPETSENAPEITPLIQDVLTAEQQAALTPSDVIASFKEGNERFINNDLTARDHSAQVRKSTYAQYPKAIVLSCVDSRVPVEDVFDRGIGDIFVARVAGNFVNEDILGSMEFACNVSGAKLILVMGHEHCGAVKAAIQDVKLGNITPMLAKIRPAMGMGMAATFGGDKTVNNPDYVHAVCESNVMHTIGKIREKSPILKEMEAKGEIAIVGAVYDMDLGKVNFLNSQDMASRAALRNTLSINP